MSCFKVFKRFLLYKFWTLEYTILLYSADLHQHSIYADLEVTHKIFPCPKIDFGHTRRWNKSAIVHRNKCLYQLHSYIYTLRMIQQNITIKFWSNARLICIEINFQLNEIFFKSSLNQTETSTKKEQYIIGLRNYINTTFEKLII